MLAFVADDDTETALRGGLLNAVEGCPVIMLKRMCRAMVVVLSIVNDEQRLILPCSDAIPDTGQ